MDIATKVYIKGQQEIIQVAIESRAAQKVMDQIEELIEDLMRQFVTHPDEVSNSQELNEVSAIEYMDDYFKSRFFEQYAAGFSTQFPL